MRIEHWQLAEADAQVKRLAIGAITAWRVLVLDRNARDAPATLIGEVLAEDEREAVEDLVRKKRLMPSTERRNPRPRDQPQLAGVAGCLLPLEATSPARALVKIQTIVWRKQVARLRGEVEAWAQRTTRTHRSAGAGLRSW